MYKFANAIKLFVYPLKKFIIYYNCKVNEKYI